MKRYAFFDVDGTIRGGSTTYDFLEYLAEKRVIGKGFVKRGKELREENLRCEIGYAEYCVERLDNAAMALKGVGVEEAKKQGLSFAEQDASVFRWVEELVDWLRKERFVVYLVSAGIEPAIGAVAGYLQADKVYATELEVVGGKYTGKVARVLNYAEKQELIHRVVGHLSKSVKLGLGDSTGDVPMLEAMDEVLVVEPHQEELKELAEKKGWVVVKKEIEAEELIDVVRRRLGK